MSYAEDLVATVRGASARLSAVGDAEASRRPGPGKWSAKEIIGHLIDSAANNHQRFVRIRWQDDLVFPGYDADAWVASQAYNEAPWQDLLTLWLHYNLRLAAVMDGTPVEIRMRERTRHNLHELAWTPVPDNVPATLDYFMRDYVGHLKHHLAQIDALGFPATAPPAAR